jgi:hypothetical protein
MGTQLTKNEPKSHKFTKSKNWAHQIYQRIQPKTRFTNTLRALLITRRLLLLREKICNNKKRSAYKYFIGAMWR